MIGIYKIENKVNGKVYIGQSINIEQRWRLHKSELRHNYHQNDHLQKAWNKYGEENFEFSILEYCTSEELNAKEIFWIKEYNSFTNYNGYNIENGGTLGTRVYNPILRFDLSGNYIDEWYNAREISDKLNISISTIYGCINKRYKCAGNYIFVSKYEYENNHDISFWISNQVHKNVYQFDLYGQLLNVFETKSLAEKYIGGGISHSLYNDYCTSHGYIWKYYDDIEKINEDYCYKTRHALNFISNNPFYKIDKSGNRIKYYNCLREAVEDGFSERLVNECLRGLRNKHKGYLWGYSSEIEKYTPEFCDNLFNTPEKKASGKVYKLDINTCDILQTFECLEHVKNFGYNPCTVGECCKGRKKQYKGYKWRCETIA